MNKKLSEMSVGESGRVAGVTAEGRIKRRLFDMGLTPSAEVVFLKAAPLGDPVEVEIRGYRLSLRKAEAASVVMEVKA